MEKDIIRTGMNQLNIDYRNVGILGEFKIAQWCRYVKSNSNWSGCKKKWKKKYWQ